MAPPNRISSNGDESETAITVGRSVAVKNIRDEGGVEHGGAENDGVEEGQATIEPCLWDQSPLTTDGSSTAAETPAKVWGISGETTNNENEPADATTAASRRGGVLFSVTGHGFPVAEKPSGGGASSNGGKQQVAAIDFIGWGIVEVAIAATVSKEGSCWNGVQQVEMQDWGVSFTLVMVGQAQTTEDTFVGCGDVLNILVSPITLWDPGGTPIFGQ